jgi:putative acetyltransferase
MILKKRGTMEIQVHRLHNPTEEAKALIAELEQELSPNYAPEQRHGLAFETIFQPHIHFFIARLNGTAAGCGGVAILPGFAEVKRMYVRSSARGQGVADAIMERLADTARNAGRTLLRLETGDRQTAAIRFYQRTGFRVCADFEPYSSMPPDNIATSVFMEKWLEPS